MIRSARYSLLLKGGFLTLLSVIIIFVTGAEMSAWLILCFAFPVTSSEIKQTKHERLIDLNSEQYAILKHVIESCIPYNEVWAYGSRVKWNASEHADLDLVVLDADSSALSDFRDALEESDLLISIDVMDWENIPDDFKENIKKKYVVVQKKSLPADWRVIKLGTITDIFTGKKNVNQTVENGAYKFFSCSPNNEYYSNEYICNNKAIIITGNGAYTGTVKFYSGKFDLYQRTYACVIKENYEQKFNIKYLFYFMKELFEKKYMGGTRGSSIPYIVKGDIENFEVLHPALPEQKKIAEMLSSLDDKIDLLHRQNKTLETMAQTLFQKWFIEDANDEWESGKLGDILDINPIYKLSKNAEAPYLEMGNISGNSYAPSTWYERKFNSGMRFINGDTLFARITPCLENGKTCFVDFLDKEQVGWGSTEYIVMRSKNNFHQFLSYVIAKNNNFRDFAISSMTGSSGRQRAQANVLIKYSIAIPPQTIIDEMNYQYESIALKLKNNSFQIRTLEKTRDLLLPKLISGKIKVKL